MSPRRGRQGLSPQSGHRPTDTISPGHLDIASLQELLDHVFRVSGEPTKKAAVTRALREFIARREQRQLAELFGKLGWDENFDHRAERSRQP
jgi:hypothetical protein